MVPNHARYHLRYTPMQLFHYNDLQHACQAKSHFSRRNICRFLFSEFLHLSAIFSLDSGSARSYTKDAAVSPVLQTLLTTSLEAGTSGLLFSFPTKNRRICVRHIRRCFMLCRCTGAHAAAPSYRPCPKSAGQTGSSFQRSHTGAAPPPRRRKRQVRRSGR